MKNHLSLLLLILLSFNINAQGPQGFNYQATVRNASGDLIVNQNVYFKFNILQGSQTAVSNYTETHDVLTDDLGQVSLVIGKGAPSNGVFSDLDWSLGNYFLDIELNTGSGYVSMGTTQFYSVPYALYAETSKNDITEEQAKAIEKTMLGFQNTFIQNENFLADIQMNIVYGQSLAMGGSTLSAEDVYTTLSFETGSRVFADTNQTIEEVNNEELQESRFISLVSMSTEGNGLNGRMMNKKWNELLRDENGKDLDNFNFNLMGFVAGVYGGQWYQLTKWSGNRSNQWVDVQPNVMPTAIKFGVNQEGKSYLSLMQGVYFANKFAKAQGKTFNVPTLSWVQGEASSDKYNTVESYYQKLEAIFEDINQDVKTLTGQTNDVQFIIYQNSSFAIYQTPTSPQYEVDAYTEGVPLACLQIARDKENVHFGTPLYPFSRNKSAGDKIHLDDVGYALMSSMFGIQGKRVITDGKPNITFYPKENEISTYSNGTNWFTRIPFDVPVKPLVFDVDGVSGVNMRGHGLQPNYGFSILNNAGEEIITNVKLRASDAITITTTENPTGLDLTYALTGVFGGGNLRDNQGDTITTTFNKITYRCDNWCPFFRITL
jgi:hypothetical protein